MPTARERLARRRRGRPPRRGLMDTDEAAGWPGSRPCCTGWRCPSPGGTAGRDIRRGHRRGQAVAGHRSDGPGRYDPDGTMTFVACRGAVSGDRRDGLHTLLGGRNMSTMVPETGRPARMDSFPQASGPVSDAVRKFGVRSSVGVPISVEGRLWGVMIVASTSGNPLPTDAEARLAALPSWPAPRSPTPRRRQVRYGSPGKGTSCGPIRECTYGRCACGTGPGGPSARCALPHGTVTRPGPVECRG
jgi:hypothetical protein